MAKKMPPAQRRQYYDDWLTSGMCKSTYARLHVSNLSGDNHRDGSLWWCSFSGAQTDRAGAYTKANHAPQ